MAAMAVMGLALPAPTSAGQMSFQMLNAEALGALASLYSASSEPAACSSHYFDWEPGGFLVRCASPDADGQDHYWLATAVGGETLGLTPLSSNAIAFAPIAGTSIPQDAKYPVRKIVNIPAEDQQAAYTQALQVFATETEN